MHACLLGTFCNFKRERQNDLFPFEEQNVPNKHACMFIRQVRVSKFKLNLKPFVLDQKLFSFDNCHPFFVIKRVKKLKNMKKNGNGKETGVNGSFAC